MMARSMREFLEGIASELMREAGKSFPLDVEVAHDMLRDQFVIWTSCPTCGERFGERTEGERHAVGPTIILALDVAESIAPPVDPALVGDFGLVTSMIATSREIQEGVRRRRLSWATASMLARVLVMPCSCIRTALGFAEYPSPTL